MSLGAPNEKIKAEHLNCCRPVSTHRFMALSAYFRRKLIQYDLFGFFYRLNRKMFKETESYIPNLRTSVGFTKMLAN